MNIHSQSVRDRLRILVVEDDPAARMAMQKFLEFRGHEVAVAATAGEAVRASEALHPEVLISDWKLGGVQDGLDVAARLSGQLDMSVIMITAHRLEPLERRARDMQLDIAAFRRKPVSIIELADLAESMSGTDG